MFALLLVLFGTAALQAGLVYSVRGILPVSPYERWYWDLVFVLVGVGLAGLGLWMASDREDFNTLLAIATGLSFVTQFVTAWRAIVAKERFENEWGTNPPRTNFYNRAVVFLVLTIIHFVAMVLAIMPRMTIGV